MTTEVKININDVLPLDVKLTTNIPNSPSIDLSKLGIPINIVGIKVPVQQLFFTDKYELVLENFSSFELKDVYDFFFSRDEFKEKISKVAVSSTKRPEEIASHNIRTMLMLLFNTSPIKNNVQDSFSFIGGSHESTNFIPKNVFQNLTNIFKTKDGNQYKIGDKIYMLTRLVWLNDFINNPVTKRLYYEYRKFRKWAQEVNPDKVLVTEWLGVFKSRRIWEDIKMSLNTKEESEFIEKYPPFKEFFYKILKNAIPSITNPTIKTILSSKSTTNVIDFFEALHEFNEDANIENINKKITGIMSIMQPTKVKPTDPNYNPALDPTTFPPTIETIIVMENGKRTIYLISDFIEMSSDTNKNNEAIKMVSCATTKNKIKKILSHLSNKNKSNVNITNENGIFSLEKGEFIKSEKKIPDLDEELGTYEVKITRPERKREDQLDDKLGELDKLKPENINVEKDTPPNDKIFIYKYNGNSIDDKNKILSKLVEKEWNYDEQKEGIIVNFIKKLDEMLKRYNEDNKTLDKSLVELQEKLVKNKSNVELVAYYNPKVQEIEDKKQNNKNIIKIIKTIKDFEKNKLKVSGGSSRGCGCGSGFTVDITNFMSNISKRWKGKTKTKTIKTRRYKNKIKTRRQQRR